MTDTVRPLEYEVAGNEDSRTLVVFLQGWPDSKEMWDQKMHSFENFKDYKQLYINLPNYGKQIIPWGQDFPVIVARLKATFDEVKGADRKILVSHDWGAIYGYIFDKTYPNYFNHIVAMDVPAYTQVEGLKQKLMVITYQLFLVVAFLIGGTIGTAMTKMVSLLFKHKPSYFHLITSGRNFPYYYTLRNIVTSALGQSERFLKGYKPSVPITYYYGLKKPFQFHGSRWEEYQRKTNGTMKAIQSGHWLMERQRDQISEEIKQVIRSM